MTVESVSALRFSDTNMEADNVTVFSDQFDYANEMHHRGEGKDQQIKSF